MTKLRPLAQIADAARAADGHPPYLYPPYRSTELRAPGKPLLILPHTLSETTGPVFGEGAVDALDGDLTGRHAGEPMGERIVVSGRVTDNSGHPIRRTLVEVWQANAAGRYSHHVDRHSAP